MTQNRIISVSMSTNTIRFVFQCFIISIFASSLLFSHAHAESLRVGYFITSPHVIIESASGKLGGACVELFEKYIAPEMGVTVVWEKRASSIPRQLKQLENHQIDVGLVFAKNEERAKILNYPENPYFVSHPTLAFLKNHPTKKIEKPEDILGLSIGYGTKAYISPFMRDKRIKFRLISSSTWFRQNFEMLIHRRIEAIYMPESPPILFMAKNLDAQDKIRLTGLPESSLLYTAFSKNVKTQLSQRYDIAFEKVGGRNMYLKILAKYIDIEKL